MPTLAELSQQTQYAFDFLSARGFQLVEERFTSGDSYRDGFSLAYANGALNCNIQYCDMEFTFSFNGLPLFNARSHLGFAGNMFSREHLIQHLPQLANVIRDALAAQSSAA